MTTTLRHVALTLIFSVALIVGGFVLSAILLQLREPPKANAVLPRIYTVSVQELHRTDFTEHLPVQGSVRAYRQAAVGAQVAGEVVWRRPGTRAGVKVQGGEVLLKLDARRFQQEVDRRQAMVMRAEASVAMARADVATLEAQLVLRRAERDIALADFQRATQLSADAVFSDREREVRESTLKAQESSLLELTRRFDNAMSAVQIEEASLRAAQADLAAAQVDLAYTEVQAPWAGVIAEMNAEVGDRAQMGQVLFTIIDLSRVEVPIQVPLASVHDVAVGARVFLHPASNRQLEFEGRLVRIAPQAQQASRTIEAYLEVDNDDVGAELLPGTFVTGRLEARQFHNVFTVPRRLIVDGVMFTVVPDTMLEVYVRGEIARRSAASPITREEVVQGLGHQASELAAQQVHVARALRPSIDTIADGMAIVREGLEPGQLVVTDNLDVIYDGAVTSPQSAAPGL